MPSTGRRPVVDFALSDRAIVPAAALARVKALDRLRLGDAVFRNLTRAAAIGVLLLLSGVIISLIDGSIPAFRTFGFGFLFSSRWNPVTDIFGAAPAIYGTVVTSFIAMLIAVPVGLMIAFFLTELCPLWLRRPIGIAVELLAGIPSIIYGITSIARDVFDTVPMLKEAAYGMGCTTWEVVRKKSSSPTRGPVSSAGVMLGLGRALGETMAVTFVIGNAHHIAASGRAPGTTISASIANEFTEALTPLYTSSPIALGPYPVPHHLSGAGLLRANAAARQRTADGLKPCMEILKLMPTSAGACATSSPWVCRSAPPWWVCCGWLLILADLIVRGGRRPLRRGLLADDAAARQRRRLRQCAVWQRGDDAPRHRRRHPGGRACGDLHGRVRAPRHGFPALVVRFINDVLLSAPSIVIPASSSYEILVVHMGHFSAFAGAAALALLVLPVVVRTTEDMLNLVPNQLREAAAALGAPRWILIGRVVYRAARAGMITGVLLAVARISGETAPLLFTALNNQFWSTNMNAPMANLPVMIFQFALSPYKDWQQAGPGPGALVITMTTILILNVVARAPLRR